MKGVAEARAENKAKLETIVGEAAPPADSDTPPGTPPTPDPTPATPPVTDPALAAQPPQPAAAQPPAPAPTDPNLPPAVASPAVPGPPDPQAPPAPSPADTPVVEDPKTYADLEKRYGNLRREYNRTANRNKLLEEQNELYVAASVQPAPMPGTLPPPAATPGQPAPVPEAPTLEDVKRKMAQDYDEDYIAQHSTLIGAIVADEMGKVRDTYDPLINNLATSVQGHDERNAEDQWHGWVREVRGAVPSFEQIADSDAFQVYLDQIPLGSIYRDKLWPPEGALGATSGEAVQIFQDFLVQAGQPTAPPLEVQPGQPDPSAQLPVAQPAPLPIAANLAADARVAAAAAASQGIIPASAPIVTGQAPVMYKTEFNREFNEVKNDIVKLKDLRLRVDASIAAGTYIDDTVPRQTSY